MDNNEHSSLSASVMESDFLQSVLDGISDSIKIIDKSFNLVYTNKSGLEMIGKPIDKAIGEGRKCFEEFYKNPQQCAYCVVEQVFRSGAPAFNIFRTGFGASYKLKEISAFPLADKSGKVEHVIEIVRDVTELKSNLAAGEEFSEIISQDPKMKEVFELIEQVAATNSTVLINGETGTGKELVARAIHKASLRSNKKFIAMNCGSFSDSLLETELFGHERGAFTGAEQRRIGKFEQGHHGTLFLDEIGDISSNMQVKILRSLQENEITRVGGNETIKIDARYIYATNVDLKEAVRQGKFREDLYYRINVIPVNLPPLRDRVGDIQLLAEHYLGIFNKMIGKNFRGFTTSALDKMMRYRWPGNIRELKNIVERAVILNKGPYIEKVDVPQKESHDETSIEDSDKELKDVVAEAERIYLMDILKAYHGNINQTAEKAGVNTRTVHRKMKEFGLTKELFKP